MQNLLRACAFIASVPILLTACGGAKNTNTTTTGTTATKQTEAQRESAALPLGGVKPVPAGLNCGATQPVWVNTHTRAYHEPGDPYYGRTKRGEYMCPSDAAQQGYHAAGSSRNAAGAGSANNGDQSGAAPSGKHHRKHRTDSGN